MNVTSSDAGPTKLARPSTRLRILLVVLLVLSPYGLWNLWAFGEVMQARYAVSKINRLGGKVLLSIKALDVMLDPTARDESVVLDWHRSFFGDTSAALVSFAGLPVTDADLSCLSGFRKVYAVCLDNTAITDAGLDCLAGRTELVSLSLRGTLVTDAGLKKLARLANLQKLQLGGTRISDAGLTCLERLPTLSELGLSQTRVTDAGLERMEHAPHLVTIDLNGTAASKAERARLKRLCCSHTPL
jgi:Leucine-rich repeat (LRR) protein